MAVDSDWFPQAEPKQVTVVQNIQDKIDNYTKTLDISAGDAADIHTLLQTFLEVVLKNVEIQATAESYTSFKNAIKNGLEGSPAPAVPVFVTMNLPGGATTGVVNQLRKLRNGWLLKKGYTPEIGADLMIIGTAEAGLVEADLEAALKLSQTGDYTTAFVFSKQGMDAMRVERRLTGTEEWHSGGDFTNSPASVTVVPTVPNQPVSIEFRGRLMSKNKPVGKWSPIYTEFVAP